MIVEIVILHIHVLLAAKNQDYNLKTSLIFCEVMVMVQTMYLCTCLCLLLLLFMPVLCWRFWCDPDWIWCSDSDLEECCTYGTNRTGCIMWTDWSQNYTTMGFRYRSQGKRLNSLEPYHFMAQTSYVEMCYCHLITYWYVVRVQSLLIYFLAKSAITRGIKTRTCIYTAQSNSDKTLTTVEIRVKCTLMKS